MQDLKWMFFFMISIGCLSELSEFFHRNIPSSHLKNRERRTRFLSYAVFQFHWADADWLGEIYKQPKLGRLRILPETSSQKALENGMVSGLDSFPFDLSELMTVQSNLF